MHTSRFYCASAPLHLGMLLKQAQKALWGAMMLAVVTHLSLSQIGNRQAAQQAAKPLTTQFVKRQPRLTKPLELKKRPRPKRRHIQRTMVSIKARVDRGEWSMGLRPASMVAQLARPDAKVVRGSALQAAVLEPEAIAQAIEGTRQTENVVDMSLEMVDIDALDTGQHHAIVIQDPNDKQNIRGFFHLAEVYSTNLPRDPVYGRRFLWPNAVPNLVKAMNQWTNIRTDLMGRHTFDSEELFKTPWILVSVCNGTFKMTETEAHCLGRYFFEGGFVLFDPAFRKHTPRSVCLRQAAKDALTTQNYLYERDWDFELLEDFTHPLFNCYFDFSDGPPVGVGSSSSYIEPLEGIFIGDRLVAVMSYICLIHWWNGGPQREHKMDGTRAFQFGVNMIIFALTQEGSITNRIMDSVR